MYNEAVVGSGRDQRARTLEEVAAVAGVSKSTVSRVINDSPGVSVRAREAVRGAIARTGYSPNRAARTLVTRRTGSIGLVVSEPEGRVFSDPFFGSMVRGASRLVRDQGIQLVLLLVEDSPGRTQLLDYLHNGHLDGVLLISSHVGDPLPASLIEDGLPAVLSGRPVNGLPISYVDVDSVAGAAMAVEHLIERGCTSIATIAGPQDMPAGQDRLAGYHAALRRAGREVREDLIATGTFETGSGARAAETLLSRGVPFDGLFVASDLMAAGALTVLREHGLRVPGDVAVVGFDNSIAALDSRPPLTTVHQPVEDMAEALTAMLLDRIIAPDGPITAQVFRPKLVIRDSG
jgi:DNA-binding LacI/PurR family transcriptional regulator